MVAGARTRARSFSERRPEAEHQEDHTDIGQRRYLCVIADKAGGERTIARSTATAMASATATFTIIGISWFIDAGRVPAQQSKIVGSNVACVPRPAGAPLR
jgi:hypothetical protein